jgi:hypothetical protein
MKTAAYNLEEAQIQWVKDQAIKNGHTSGSAIVRVVLTDAMNSGKRVVVAQGLDGVLKVDKSLVNSPVRSTEQVSTN